ncbi:protocadherin-20 [Xiphophorus hellerii]|uniref:protocadherin-20 n=1 Tax=Xiphophorus hellerii TaxID=8084 RepID=UPI0013B3887D|nr:protocadherin-20-like [Xiphophorus hellerii]
MGHGTPDNMNWAGLLQKLLIMLHTKQIICGSIHFSIKEELEPHTLVGSLNKHFSPPYQLLTEEYLWMNKSTGNFYITEKKIDREHLCSEETKDDECIILQSVIVGPARELEQFSVIIEDINDNAPYFENSKICLDISEDVPAGTSLMLDDQARDRDSGPNGQLKYELKGSGGVFSLKVEEEGPLIKLIVQKALDRETQDLYQMQLVATDCGVQPLSVSVPIFVTVTDVNDNCPSFSPNSPLSATISGDSKKDTVVTQVVAADPDLGPNAAIVYSLSPKVSERAKKLLILSSHSGHIRLTQDLEIDSSEELVLKVLASGLHCPPAETQVTVSLLPKATQGLTIKIGFIAKHYNQTVVIPESQPPTPLAVLEPEGDSSFKDSSLAIEGDVPFFLSPQSGKYLLSTSKPLDYEMKSEYHISVVVKGSSSERSVIAPPQLEIRVMVEDVNDNAPHFSQTDYQLEVEENNEPALILLQVSATDADSGLNGRVTYRLDKHTSAIFKVDSVTGQLSALVPLDREQKSVHKLTVFARDSGVPPLESQASVIIRVLDRNDNAPVFSTPHFIFFIPENAPPFAQVGLIEVEDPDEGENGKIEMQIVQGNTSFVVGSIQRMLYTTTNLDREMTDRHELYLAVSDNGRPVALTSSARVTIFIEDINDNNPKVILPSSNYSCLVVSPATPVGTNVTKVYAIDEDSGVNSEITYSVVAPKSVWQNTPFQVDSKSGNITLRQELLQENMGMHNLFIVVRDNGKPTPLYTTVWINLLVNKSTDQCHLDRAPTWTGRSDWVESASMSPVCEVETARSVQVIYFYLVLCMAVVIIVLFFTTVCLYLKHRKYPPKKKMGHTEENEIPLRIKDKYYSDE